MRSHVDGAYQFQRRQRWTNLLSTYLRFQIDRIYIQNGLVCITPFNDVCANLYLTRASTRTKRKFPRFESTSRKQSALSLLPLTRRIRVRGTAKFARFNNENRMVRMYEIYRWKSQSYTNRLKCQNEQPQPSRVYFK